MVRTALTFFSFLICLQLSAQKIDSLEQLMLNSSDIERQIELHDLLAKENFNKGNYPAVLEHRQAIFDLLLELSDSTRIGAELYQIGRTHYYMRTDSISNAKTLDYMQKALRTAKATYDSITIMKCHGAIGIILSEGVNRVGGKEANLDSAISRLKRALDFSEKLNDDVSTSNFLSILGTFYINQEKFDQASNCFNDALEIALKSGDQDAVAFSKGKLGYSAYLKGDKAEALKQYNDALTLYRKLDQLDGQLNTYRYLTLVYRDHYDSPQDHIILDSVHREFLSLTLEMYNDRTAQAVMEAEEKFNTEKKEEQIKTLEAESKIQELRLSQSRSLIYTLITLAFLLVIGFLLYSSRRRYKIKALLAEEKERTQTSRFNLVIAAEEKERKRIAQELHDGLGQLLSTARMSLMTLEEETNARHSMSLIDRAIDETRSVSHNLMPNALTSVGLEESVLDLARTIQETGSIQVDVDIQELPPIGEMLSISIYRILQELLTNALKYSEADRISIRLFQRSRDLIMEVGDNGKGFDTSKIESSQGIGWKNIQSRLGLMNGDLQIHSTEGKGTSIIINIPV